MARWDPRSQSCGAGIMGSATAYALARDGHDVVLYEQFEVGHTRGSSHGRSRIVRLAYPEVEFVELAKESFAGWRELEREAGVAAAGAERSPRARRRPRAGVERGTRRRRRRVRAARRRRSAGALAGRRAGGWTALFQPEAGIVRADLAHRAFVDRARRAWCAVAGAHARRVARRARRRRRRPDRRALGDAVLPRPPGPHDARDGRVLPARRRAAAVGRAA